MPKQLQTRRFLAIENFHSKSDRFLLEHPATGEPCALFISDAGGMALVLQEHGLVLQIGPHDTLCPGAFVCFGVGPSQFEETH